MSKEKSNERITIIVSKRRKEELQSFADKNDLTLSGLIKIALYEYMKKNS